MDKLKTLVSDFFEKKFNVTPIVISSPGRINLIGEHTDYNMGFVLPAAIDKGAYVAISKTNNETINLYALDLNDEFTTTLKTYTHSAKEWPNYIIGVVDELIKMGKVLGGFNAVFAGNVPLGAGMSSSAALECATVFALNHIFDLGLSKLQMAQIAQQAEREFVGVKCGIMDQFASVFGKKNHVIKLDCRSLEYTYVPFNIQGIKIVLFDSMVKHSLASTEYNLRSQQCQQGVAIIQQKFSQVQTLRDATIQMVDDCLANGDLTIYNRCKYVVEEIDRLILACADLTENNLEAFGQKMYATHKGLSQLYQVSCPQLDFIADCALLQPDILGARMMGGGFGGCVIALIKDENYESIIEEIKTSYQQKWDKEMKVYVMSIEDGARVVV
ncbi:MAG: galactokinase [Sphingobacteriales bacterium]|nr:MAG: galactokinase [Sphingobacteriales bacterium]